MTVLALGAQIPDTIASISMARHGVCMYVYVCVCVCVCCACDYGFACVCVSLRVCVCVCFRFMGICASSDIHARADSQVIYARTHIYRHPDGQTHTRMQIRAHTRTHTHTHKHAIRTRTHTRTHTHRHTHTHTHRYGRWSDHECYRIAGHTRHTHTLPPSTTS
jgi:hypothetical protein